MSKQGIRQKTFSNESGYSMLIAIFALVLLSVLGISIFTISGNTMKISDNERTDQAVYYVAEAALVEIKANISEAIEQAQLNTLKNIDLKKPLNDSEIKNIKNQIINNIKVNILNLNIVVTPYVGTKSEKEKEYNPYNKLSFFKNFEPNNGLQPSAEYIVELKKDEVGENFAYLIKTKGRIDNKERILKQDITVYPENFFNAIPATGAGESENGGNQTDPIIPPKNKLNACFALYTNGSITSTGGGGEFEGDIYSNEPLTIKGSPKINGNIYSTENIIIEGTPTGVKNIISEKNITLTGWSTISGNVQAKGSITSNSTISGTVSAGSSITILGGVIGGNAQANNNLALTEGTINGSAIANSKIEVTGGTIKGNIESNGDVIIQKWPNLQKDVIAKNNIYVKENYFELPNGKFMYGGEFINKNNKVNTLQKNPNININTNISTPSLSNVINNDCTEGIISLPDSNKTFSIPENKIYTENKKITVQNKNYEIIKDNSLKINNYLANNYTLELDKDLYFKSMDFSSDYTLNIDLKGGDRTIYVDSLNLLNGHINIINPGSGKLNIQVLNKLATGAGSTINKNGQPSSVNISYSGTNKVEIAGGVTLNTNLNIKNADLTMTGGGRVNGDVFVYGENEVTLSGGSSSAEQLFLAPKSKFTQTGGAIVTGNVVAKDYIFSGGAKIIPPKKNVPLIPEDNNDNSTPAPNVPDNPADPEDNASEDEDSLDFYRLGSQKEVEY